MKSDKFWMSAIWGRIGAALILIVGTVLQSQGVEVTQEQMENANSLINSLISNLHIALAAGIMIVSKLREKWKEKKAADPDATSGQIKNAVLPMLALIMIASVSLPWMTSGCAHKSVTQQIVAQTRDPATIALATLADAQDAYIAAAELYQPYQKMLRESNPALDREIVGYLRSADLILAKWETYGDVPAGNKEALRDYLRKVSIRTAQMIEEGGEHGQNR